MYICRYNIWVVNNVNDFYVFQNNPTEARTMLLLNPQLAYALLQAQVVMRIVDPQIAVVSNYY